METIRILIYTDVDYINEDPCEDFGISELKRLLLFKAKRLCKTVRFEVKLINRHDRCDGANPLTGELLSHFDQLWLFGFLTTNEHDHPKNELDNEELRELERWMNAGGGLFITGDHSNPDERICDGDPRKENPETFLNLGRAIGYRVPRAGQLRVWEGPPTRSSAKIPLEERDNFNTLVGPDVTTLDNDKPNLQADNHALDLDLVLTPGGLPHKLFWWYVEGDKLVPITKFPDHMHEGRLRIPGFLNGEWTAPEPFPEVVARARDNRPFQIKRTYDLVSVYDGSKARPETSKVGRIVVDSSFHHYLNINLVGFERDVCGNPLPFSTLDQIAKYHLNLAVWLTPRIIVEEVRRGLLFEAVTDPQVVEIKGSEINKLGETARSSIERRIGLSNLYQLLAPSSFDEPLGSSDILIALLLLGKSNALELSADERERVLGRFIRIYHDTLTTQDLVKLESHKSPPLSESVFDTNLIQAFVSESESMAEYVSAGYTGIEKLFRLGNGLTS